MGACRSPALLCGVVLLLGLAGSVLGDHVVSNVTLTSSFNPPLMLGESSDNMFTCSVNVTCDNGMCLNSSTLRVVWLRGDTNITSDTTNYNVTGLIQNMVINTDASLILTSNLTLKGSVLAIHRGQYTCQAVLNNAVSTMNPTPMTLTVKIPAPTAALTGDTVSIGSTASLSCAVNLSAFDTYMSIQNTLSVTVELLNGSNVILTNSSSSGSGSSRTSIFTLSNVGVFDAGGQYQCSATVSSNASNVTASDPGTNSATLTVSVPSPSATLTGNIIELGTPATLQCTVMLNSTLTCPPSSPVAVMVDLVQSGSTTVIDSEAVMGSGSTCDPTMLTLPMTASLADGRQYQCRVRLNYTGSNNAFVMLPTGDIMSNIATLYVVGSNVTASPDTVLDAFPYNNFTLNCNVTTNPPVSSISYQWSGNNVTSMNSSTITVLSNSTGTTPYQCNATASVSGLNSLSVVRNDDVTVNGPARPNVPSNVMNSTVPDGATITFMIGRVAYTPETYTIEYGTLLGNLNSTSEPITSRDVDDVHSFIGQMNVEYTITLTGLAINTMYFYRVVAENTFGMNTTGLLSFTTMEAPPGRPSNPAITVIGSRSFRFTWAVPMETNGDITGYNYTCVQIETNNVISSNSILPNTTSVVITGLSPFTNYNCSVSASTAQGVGPPASIIEMTTEEAPETAPINFTISSTNSTTLTLQWSPPVIPNGMIRMYRYTCAQVGMRGEGDSSNGPSSGGQRIDMMTSMMMTTVSGLNPFTNYNCSVSAITIGQGPAASDTGITMEGVPEMVTDVVVRGMSDDTFRVQWRSPMIDNGLITVYSILVADYTTGAVINRTNMTAVSQDDTNSYSQNVTSQQLEQGVPYNVSVAAYTSAGMGPAVLQTEFTTEGIPVAVMGIDVMRINDTALTVSWTPLTIVQARGRLTDYLITLTPTEPSSRKRQARTVMATAEPSASSADVGGLVATQHYLVSVAGRTNVGEGPTIPGLVQTPAVIPTDDNTVLIAAVVAIGVVVVLILTVVLVILIVCFLMTRRSTKLHTLTVKENEIALNIVDNDNGSNGKGIELKAIETKTALDEDAIRRCEPVPMEEFPQHCGKLHFNRDLGFEEEYETFKNVPKGSFMVSKLPSNTPKNRFENVYSFDDARVILPTIEGVAGSDYMNASYMNGYRKDNAYIAAQGPLPHTVGDFWRMVWELKLPTIVMLTELIERGIEKCHCYWPKNINRTLDVGFGLKVTLVEQKAFVEYKYKEIAVTNSNDPSSKPLKVTHYHFTAWPDHGVPADKTCMLAFIKRVRKTHPPDGPPLLVHCSAGVGRTGTFIVLDSNLQRMKAESTLNIYELITDMRTRRVLMVQTEAQYVYIHDALQEYIVCGDTSIPAEKIRAVTLTLQKVSEHKSGYQKQFELLDEVSFKPSESYCMDALAKENSEKNRFPQQLETLPYNNTRVRFRTMTGIGGGAGGEGGGSNYINASYVDGYKHRGAFLATQTPLKETVEDFWHMIWETQSKAIVMLCNLEEEGKDPYPQYWPAKSGELERYGKMKVKLISEKADTEFVTRKLELSLDTDYINLTGEGEDQFVVTQFHYTKWPEQGKPSTPAGMLKMMEPLLKTQQAAGNKSITVVCSDGVGRTGAFACIYSQLERVKTEAMADFFQYIKGSRFQRPGLVQTLDHYIYCHEVVCEFLSSFDNYHNFQGGDQ